ncbi:MAG: DNA ligase D [Myxococcaceae bacterium]
MRPPKRDLAAALKKAAETLGATRAPVALSGFKPMLAQVREKPFNSKDWIFELKQDGYRVIAAPNRLQFRSGRDATHVFPEIAEAMADLPAKALIDGEAVVLDARGRSSFLLLQQRGQLRDRREIAHARAKLPVTFVAFDLLALEGLDLRKLPLVHRKGLLRELIPAKGIIRYSEHVEERGELLFKQVERRGLEGIMAKKADSPYQSARSPSWLKITQGHHGDFAVVGFAPPQGSRIGFGSLHLAVNEDGVWRFCGSVGSGFSDKLLAQLRAELDPLKVHKPPFEGELPLGKGHTWLRPERVAEVRYKQWPEGGWLRASVFLRMRDDKSPEECVDTRDAAQPNVGRRSRAGQGETQDLVSLGSPRVELKISRWTKVFWPEEGYTKGDLIEYYRAISPWLLPYLQDRPLILTRFPDGIRGKSFFQKDAPVGTPDWIRRVPMWSAERRENIQQLVCEDLDSLTYLINLGTIPLHIPASRVSSLDRPDWSIVDLDPKGAPFANVIALARALHELCDEIGLPSYAKTSGGTGLHVMVPLGGALSHQQATALAELLAHVVAREHPTIATIERVVAARGGRVYLDYLQNGDGKLLAAPYCVRPVAGATASAPLLWKEVNARLSPSKFTLQTLPLRMRKLEMDPLREIFSQRPDVSRALEKLSERLASI